MPTEGKVAWLITINNPIATELDPIKTLTTSTLSGCLKYAKWAMEEGEGEQTPHIHCYIHLSTQQRFSAIKAIFPRAHIDDMTGTPQQIIDYIGNPDYTHAETHPDPRKAGKRKGGKCTASGEYGSTDGIKLNKAANGEGKGVMERRLLKIKQLIDDKTPIIKLWDEDFYIMCRNFQSINNYYTIVNGVSIKELLDEREREREEKREKEQHEILKTVNAPLAHWPREETAFTTDEDLPF